MTATIRIKVPCQEIYRKYIMDCVNCGVQLGIFGNYGSESRPLCYDCFEMFKNEPTSGKPNEPDIHSKIEEDSSSNFILVQGYLSKGEAECIVNNLKENNIPSYTEPFLPVGKFSTLYDVRVEKGKLEEAIPIVQTYLRDQKQASEQADMKNNKCPKCGATEFFEADKLNIFQRIYYAGCKPWKCLRCGKTWTT